ncbi:MAG TPA: exodeoxyribonuclease VII small subunit [Candidatus Acidoferrales bacterium]|nr:exodeoxyribonuclease VII small subunit [Candidatus Acidoferrales bacterium]
MSEALPILEEALPLDRLLQRLEALMESLARGDAPLEQLVADHNRAIQLLEVAQRRLDEAGARIAPR